METPVQAQLIDKHVIIWDHELGSEIYQLGYFGKPVGIRKPKSPRFDRPLELTLLEAAFLLGRLMVQAEQNKPPINLIAFKERVVEEVHTRDAVRDMIRSCQPMIKRANQ